MLSARKEEVLERRDLIKEIIRERMQILHRLSEKEVIVPTPQDTVEANRNIMDISGGIFSIRDENLLNSVLMLYITKSTRKNN